MQFHGRYKARWGGYRDTWYDTKGKVRAVTLTPRGSLTQHLAQALQDGPRLHSYSICMGVYGKEREMGMVLRGSTKNIPREETLATSQSHLYSSHFGTQVLHSLEQQQYEITGNPEIPAISTVMIVACVWKSISCAHQYHNDTACSLSCSETRHLSRFPLLDGFMSSGAGVTRRGVGHVTSHDLIMIIICTGLRG